RAPADAHGGLNRTVADVVAPAGVVGEGGCLRARLRRGGAAPAAQHQQPAGLVRAQLAEIHRRVVEAAAVEGVARIAAVAVDARARDAARAGVDRQLGAVVAEDARVATAGAEQRRRGQARPGRLRLRTGDIKRLVE